MGFKLVSDYKPCGHQPQAIESLCSGIQNKVPSQILKGVTGSGKTYVMANVIEKMQRPTLIITHNKTLVGQLYQEFRSFFPENAVEYFVSYYDYYQPEAYVPSSDTFIEKDASINDEIDYMRHRGTASLFEREDIIIVASVSCIYGLGSPENYVGMKVSLSVGDIVDRDELLRELVRIQYSRSDFMTRGSFRVRGDCVEVFPKTSETGIRIVFFGDEVEEIAEWEPLQGKLLRHMKTVNIFPAQHYVTPQGQREKAIEKIKAELEARESLFLSENKLIEAQRIRERTLFDLEMLQEVGYCNGVENYSRHLDGREAGSPPDTLIDYLPHNAMIFLDESHVTIPQLKGMYNGDFSRKSNLVNYGFRLPSALDNRPLKYEEFSAIEKQLVYVSATPGPVELENARAHIIPLIVRPTGLLDPKVEIRPSDGQIDDIMHEIQKRAEKNERVFVTTLTKKMAEHLTEYLCENGIRCRYLHSDIEAIERLELIRELRLGSFDVLVGINLLREGLDAPEVSLVCVLDADKEGFLRSSTSLIQTSGRAARHLNGTVIFYADRLTDAMKSAIREADERRKVQEQFNRDNGITPTSVVKKIAASLYDEIPAKEDRPEVGRVIQSKEELEKELEVLRVKMRQAAQELDFEQAATLRDRIYELMGKQKQKVQKVSGSSSRKARRI
jgi:excinuclease ABC subunit B